MAELEETKSKLQAILKTSFDQYWDHFKKFIRGKTPKIEFDGYVKSLLGDTHIHLHNQLVLILLRTTHKIYVPRVPIRPTSIRDHALKQKKFGISKPPLIGKPSKDKLGKDKRLAVRPLEQPAEPPSPNKRKLTPQESAAAAAAAAAKRQRMAPRVDPLAIKLKRFRDTAGMLRPMVVRPRPAAPPASRSTDADRQLAAISPELAALRQRMLRLALEHGLTEVSNESVQLTMLALEQHMKTILANCNASGRVRVPGPAPVDASPVTAAAHPPAAPAPATTPAAPTAPTAPAPMAPAASSSASSMASSSSAGSVLRPKLTTPDLYAALRCGPYLLGEDLVLNQERLVAFTSFH